MECPKELSLLGMQILTAPDWSGVNEKSLTVTEISQSLSRRFGGTIRQGELQVILRYLTHYCYLVEEGVWSSRIYKRTDGGTRLGKSFFEIGLTAKENDPDYEIITESERQAGLSKISSACSNTSAERRTGGPFFTIAEIGRGPGILHN